MHAFFMPHIPNQIVLWLWIGHILNTRPLMLISRPRTNFLVHLWHILFPHLQNLSLQTVSNDGTLDTILYDFMYCIWPFKSLSEWYYLSFNNVVLKSGLAWWCGPASMVGIATRSLRQPWPVPVAGNESRQKRPTLLKPLHRRSANLVPCHKYECRATTLNLSAAQGDKVGEIR